MNLREELELFGLRREQRARQEGRTEGRKRGLDEASATARQILIGVLTERFGPLAERPMARLEEASLKDLVRWSLRARTAATVKEALAGTKVHREVEGFGLRRERLQREEGRTEGWTDAQNEARTAARQILAGALTTRFGPLAVNVRACLEGASVEHLVRWSLRVRSSATVIEALAG